MILACLNCSARFLVPEGAIGARGRMVRCGRCDHVWFAAPPPELVRSAADTAGRRPLPSPGPPAPVEEKLSAPPLRDPDELRIDRPPARAQLPVLREERRRWPSRLAWAAVAVIAVALVAAGAWRYRAEIAESWPFAETVYASIGLDPLPRGFGLDLTIESSENAIREGARVLSITARIENTTSRSRSVPDIRGALFDENQRELRHWTIAAPVTNLAPDREVEFDTEVIDPPQEAVRISIAFDEPG